MKSKAIDTMRERVLFVMPAIGNDAAVATAAIVASRTTFRAGRRAARGEIVQQGDRGSEVADGNRQLILVVEDDPELRDEILRPGLHEAGFDTIGAGSAIEAYRSMLSQDYSMLILDIGLPDEDGFTLARNLREVTDAGIIMLTGRSYSNVERARALNESADAYLTKPVDIDVLSATVRSILRRQHGQPATESRRPPPGWHLDMNGWNLVTSGGHNIRLTHAERGLLELLFANPSEIGRAHV